MAEEVDEAPGVKVREEGGGRKGVCEERDRKGELDESGVVEAEENEVLTETSGGDLFH